MELSVNVPLETSETKSSVRKSTALAGLLSSVLRTCKLTVSLSSSMLVRRRSPLNSGNTRTQIACQVSEEELGALATPNDDGVAGNVPLADNAGYELTVDAAGEGVYAFRSIPPSFVATDEGVTIPCRSFGMLDRCEPVEGADGGFVDAESDPVNVDAAPARSSSRVILLTS